MQPRLFALAAVAVASSLLCKTVFAVSSCKYTYTNTTTNTLYTWDLSSLASTGGYKASDPLKSAVDGVDYLDNAFSINLCANSSEVCRPQGYVPPASKGVVVNTWGSVPPGTADASGPYCQQGNSRVNGEYCTANCTVFATSLDALSMPYKPELVGTGDGDGLILQFPVVIDANVDRTICEVGSPILAAQYSILCKPSIEFEVYDVVNMGCEFNFIIFSKFGCATKASGTTTTTSSTTPPVTGMSPGSVFLLILFIVAVLYFGVGTVILRFTTGAWGIPNRTAWVAFGALITDGVNFIKGGCRKTGGAGTAGAVTGGAYDGGAGDYTQARYGNNDFGDSATAKASAAEPYDDL